MPGESGRAQESPGDPRRAQERPGVREWLQDDSNPPVDVEHQKPSKPRNRMLPLHLCYLFDLTLLYLLNYYKK